MYVVFGLSGDVVIVPSVLQMGLKFRILKRRRSYNPVLTLYEVLALLPMVALY